MLIGAGSVNLLALAFAATADTGDEVVFAWPSFEMYPILVAADRCARGAGSAGRRSATTSTRWPTR